MNTDPILIIGKNGKTGARVQQRLAALGIPVRAVSRSTTPAFDWEDESTWQAALDGTRAAYVTFQPDLAIPTAEDTIKRFVALAESCELEHLVLLSGRGEDGAKKAETVLQHANLSWNIVRASWFAQNFSEGFMLDGILNGELALPAGNIPEPFIDVDDIADVAVAALTNSTLKNRVFEVTGPRSITFAECVQEISNATGQPIQYTQLPLDVFLQALAEHNVPKDLLWLMEELFTVVFDGRNTQVMSGVQDALGRPATDFKEYVQKTMASGCWGTQLIAAT